MAVSSWMFTDCNYLLFQCFTVQDKISSLLSWENASLITSISPSTPLFWCEILCAVSRWDFSLFCIRSSSKKFCRNAGPLKKKKKILKESFWACSLIKINRKGTCACGIPITQHHVCQSVLYSQHTRKVQLNTQHFLEHSLNKIKNQTTWKKKESQPKQKTKTKSVFQLLYSYYLIRVLSKKTLERTWNQTLPSDCCSDLLFF